MRMDDLLLSGTRYRYDSESGYMVSTEHQQIAEIIADYDPNLRLQWIPPDKREPGIAPFVIVHTLDGRETLVMEVQEDELDYRVLARLFAADTRRRDVMTELELNNAAYELLQAKKHEDEQAERREFALSVLKSPLHTYKHDGVTYT